MYTNEEIMKLKNSVSLKRVRIWKSKMLNKLVRGIKNNKFLIATISAFLLFSIVNSLMICTFFKILQTRY